MAAALPFEAFRFENPDEPLLSAGAHPGLDDRGAAAAHFLVRDGTVHYLWGARPRPTNEWRIMHSTAPASDPAAVSHDPGNPVLEPSARGFDEWSVEYPSPFYSPRDGRVYAYYLGRTADNTEATGLAVSTGGDLSDWERVVADPVLAPGAAYDATGAAHPSSAVVGDTVHLLYTARAAPRREEYRLAHATAPLEDPADVHKDPRNPVFEGTGEPFDAGGVREGELFVGPEHVHVLYGGWDGDRWRIGHVRTRDFESFEANPSNPVLAGTPGSWDAAHVLTPVVRRIGGRLWLLYAADDGTEGYRWQTGLAAAQ